MEVPAELVHTCMHETVGRLSCHTRWQSISGVFYVMLLASHVEDFDLLSRARKYMNINMNMSIVVRVWSDIVYIVSQPSLEIFGGTYINCRGCHVLGHGPWAVGRGIYNTRRKVQGGPVQYKLTPD